MPRVRLFLSAYFQTFSWTENAIVTTRSLLSSSERNILVAMFWVTWFRVTSSYNSSSVSSYLSTLYPLKQMTCARKNTNPHVFVLWRCAHSHFIARYGVQSSQSSSYHRLPFGRPLCGAHLRSVWTDGQESGVSDVKYLFDCKFMLLNISAK